MTVGQSYYQLYQNKNLEDFTIGPIRLLETFFFFQYLNSPLSLLESELCI